MYFTWPLPVTLMRVYAMLIQIIIVSVHGKGSEIQVSTLNFLAVLQVKVKKRDFNVNLECAIENTKK